MAVEPTATPTLTKGSYQYDVGDTVRMTPMVKMHTLGHDFELPDEQIDESLAAVPAVE